MTEADSRGESGQIGSGSIERDPVEPSAAELAEVALAHPAVVRLYPGRYGEVGTYLPGRRIAGVRVSVDGIEIHLVVRIGVPVHLVAAQVREAVRPVAGGLAVHIVVADLIDPADPADLVDPADPADQVHTTEVADALDLVGLADTAETVDRGPAEGTARGTTAVPEGCRP